MRGPESDAVVGAAADVAELNVRVEGSVADVAELDVDVTATGPSADSDDVDVVGRPGVHADA